MIWNNGNIQEGSLSSYPSSGRKGLIYEVVRVRDSTPVFLPEHMARFWKAWNQNENQLAFTDTDLMKGFFDVIRENKLANGNLRLQIGLADGSVQIGIIPHHYPSMENYQKGIVVDLVNLQRDNPNVKSWNKNVREFSDEYIRTNKVYEVILTSDEGYISEGSRSNIFGFKKGVLITPPVKDVLPGITRQKIIEIADRQNIPFHEELIHKEDICNFQSFFLTGTSPGILPIRSIGNMHLYCESNICDNIRKSYEQEIKKSIKQTGKLSIQQ